MIEANYVQIINKKNENIVICQTIPFNDSFDFVLKRIFFLILFLLKLVFLSQLFMSTHSLSARAVLMPSIRAWAEHVTW